MSAANPDPALPDPALPDPALPDPALPDRGNSSRRSHNTTVAAHAAAWAFVFLILRIFAVSSYDWDTAFLVSTTLGLDDGLALVFGSLMAGRLLTAILLIVVLPLLIAGYFWGPRERRPVVMLLTTVALATMAALTASFNHWWLPAATAGVLAVFTLLRRFPLPDRGRRLIAQVLARVGWVAGVAVLLVAAFVQTPWVPHERIETPKGTVSGYVLSVDSGYLNILTDQHEFVILLTGEVLSRV